MKRDLTRKETVFVASMLFLCFLGILMVRALLSPMGEIGKITPSGDYASGAFFTGILEGYNTMDALAGLAFGIVVVNVIQSLGVERAEAVAKNTVRAGILSSVLMGLIYILVTVVGAQSRGIFPVSANGGEALAVIAGHYFGKAGAVILAATVTVACLKTAVGLITSCAQTFLKIFPGGPSYTVWSVGFCVLSFLAANLGLNAIIAYSMPVLRFLYPLAITLILLTLLGQLFGNDRRVNILAEKAQSALPFAEQGFGWICPAVLGLVIGLAVHMSGRNSGEKDR